MSRDPLLLRLPPSLLTQGFDLARLLAQDGRWSWAEGYRLLERFALADYEKRFARELLRARTNLWLFRSNQRSGCGDFVVVDMSSPNPSERRAVVVELKLGEPLSEGRGGASPQLAHQPEALEELARETGIVSGAFRVALARGDPREVLGYLGVDMDLVSP